MNFEKILDKLKNRIDDSVDIHLIMIGNNDTIMIVTTDNRFLIF